MMDVEFFAVFGPSNIRVHPLLNFLLSVVNATIADTTTAMPVHSTHHGWLENLHKRMVYILIRPQLWFVDDTPFSGALIIPLLLLRLGELALMIYDLLDDMAQILYTRLHILFNPCDRFVWPVFRQPPVTRVYLHEGKHQVVV